MADRRLGVASSANQPATAGSGRLELDGLARPRRTALGLPEQMPFSSWRRIGKQLFLISEASSWWLGDWLVYGETAYPHHYRQAINDTGLDYKTLRNYAWVTRKFPRARRREALTFHHHAEVAGYPESEQDHWLDMAERLHWSRRDLRDHLRAARRDHVKPLSATVPVLIQPLPQQRDLWREAAQSLDSNFEEWVVMTLDEAARQILTNGNGEPRTEGVGVLSADRPTVTHYLMGVATNEPKRLPARAKQAP